MVRIDVIYEDESLLVVNKPAGLVVNRAQSVRGETLQDWLDCQEWMQVLPPGLATDFTLRSGLVHRIDKETSGLLLVAKDEDVFRRLQREFAERRVSKVYMALVHGEVENDRGSVHAGVGRLRWNRERFGVTDEGREASTEYEVVSRYRVLPQPGAVRKHPGMDFGYTLLRIYPKTGRTHQIRVHMKYIGHPVVGDEFYAGRKTARDDRKWCPRLFLHASGIAFSHPRTGENLCFVSPLPADLSAVLEVVATEEKKRLARE